MTRRFTILSVILGTILLTSCNDQQQVITSYRYMVVHPPEAMMACPILKEFPSWRTLTDSQVAKLIVQLQKNNITCSNSIESIKKFLQESENIINN